MNTQWKVSGTYFEACNCDVACPCVFTSVPTAGECKALIAWHVDEGRYEEVQLDGLNTALFAFAPGHMLQTKWRVALYLDEQADQRQRDALGKIFSGQAGGPLGALGPLIGEVMGVKSAAITYKINGKQRSLNIAGIADMEITAIEGQNGADVTISNHPFTPVPGFPSVVGRSSRLQYQDHGFNVEISQKNGFYSPFAYQPA
ncbi:MAG: hypothetical protein RL020_1179 [Pseudomonadota bacterium]|jgi:hypothetical protein